MTSHRWDESIQHFGAETDLFLRSYFQDSSRKVALVCGAGFDPRSTELCKVLCSINRGVTIYLLREHRPEPSPQLLELAEVNIAALAEIADLVRIDINILAEDSAVVGGRNLVKLLKDVDWKKFTDVVVDASALSTGITFPLVRFLVEKFEREGGLNNLHLVICQNPALDEAIAPQPVEAASTIHGFRGGWNLDSNKDSAVLWLPQLARRRNLTLQRIHTMVAPHDTCPVLPFPSLNPRLNDELSVSFIEELAAWGVDSRNLILAAEADPLDLYRTLIRLDAVRQKVFRETGGSLLVLSPTGSKLLAVGSLLAALERDLPVFHIESIGYQYSAGQTGPMPNAKVDFVHIWLEGDAYTLDRAPLKGILKK